MDGELPYDPKWDVGPADPWRLAVWCNNPDHLDFVVFSLPLGLFCFLFRTSLHRSSPFVLARSQLIVHLYIQMQRHKKKPSSLNDGGECKGCANGGGCNVEGCTSFVQIQDALVIGMQNGLPLVRPIIGLPFYAFTIGLPKQAAAGVRPSLCNMGDAKQSANVKSEPITTSSGGASSIATPVSSAACAATTATSRSSGSVSSTCTPSAAGASAASSAPANTSAFNREIESSSVGTSSTPFVATTSTTESGRATVASGDSIPLPSLVISDPVPLVHATTMASSPPVTSVQNSAIAVPTTGVTPHTVDMKSALNLDAKAVTDQVTTTATSTPSLVNPCLGELVITNIGVAISRRGASIDPTPAAQILGEFHRQILEGILHPRGWKEGTIVKIPECNMPFRIHLLTRASVECYMAYTLRPELAIPHGEHAYQLIWADEQGRFPPRHVAMQCHLDVAS